MIAGSRRARQTIQGLQEGEKIPDGLLSGEAGIIPLVVPYDVRGRRERLVYLSRGGDLTAYEELRAGFTAAVSHELRTPLARLLVAARDRDAARRGRAPPRRPGTQRGRADPRADRRGALPQRARVRHTRRLARLGRRQAGARGGGGRARGAREPRGSGARGRGRPGDRARDPAAHDARRRAEPRRELDPLRRPGSDVHARGRARGRHGRRPRAPTTASASTSRS